MKKYQVVIVSMTEASFNFVNRFIMETDVLKWALMLKNLKIVLIVSWGDVNDGIFLLLKFSEFLKTFNLNRCCSGLFSKCSYIWDPPEGWAMINWLSKTKNLRVGNPLTSNHSPSRISKVAPTLRWKLRSQQPSYDGRVYCIQGLLTWGASVINTELNIL
jgi:hypothetical protein